VDSTHRRLRSYRWCALDPADYQRTVETLMKGGSDPVITSAPVGAWTHAITDKAL